LRNLSSLSRALAIAKTFSWTAWAALFIWTAHKDIELGWLILLCLLGTWLVVKLTHDFEELTRRKEQAERELHKKQGEETFAAELEALEKLDQTEFARVLDEEWERIRSSRGVRYSKESGNLYTDTLGRPLSDPVLQGLSVERLKLVIQLALERPRDYAIFYERLRAHPYLASSLPTPEEIERHRSAPSVAEFLKAWKGSPV
jgi:hypothetical protein